MPATNPVTGQRALTTPDLVLLSLLAERPLHGYQANMELERRQVQDWAGISRPQIYYSLEKLARLALITEAGDREPALGPERRIFSTTAKGRAALAPPLAREDGANNPAPPRFSRGWPFPGKRLAARSSNSSSVENNSWRPSSRVNWQHCARLKKK